MGWRFVRQPDGKLAVFSEVVDGFTYFNLDRSEALDACSEHGLRGQLAEQKIAGAEMPAASGQSRWDEAIALMRLQHGARGAFDRLVEMGMQAELGVIAPLSAVPDLLGAESPLEWAYENLTFVGAGDHSSIFAYNDDPEVVLRVSDYPDGAFGYAESMRLNWSEAAAAHSPVAYDFAFVDGVYFGTFERLTKIDDDDEQAKGWVVTIRAIAQKSTVSAEDRAALVSAQPLLIEFLDQVGDARDLRDENWMLRGRHLVLNDPRAAMPFTEARLFAARHERGKPGPTTKLG